jgi:hypothetical protein
MPVEVGTQVTFEQGWVFVCGMCLHALSSTESISSVSVYWVPAFVRGHDVGG